MGRKKLHQDFKKGDCVWYQDPNPHLKPDLSDVYWVVDLPRPNQTHYTIAEWKDGTGESLIALPEDLTLN